MSRGAHFVTNVFTTGDEQNSSGFEENTGASFNEILSLEGKQKEDC